MKILLAEDHTMIAEAIADRLRTRGHDVTIAPTAADLLLPANWAEAELLIVDVRLGDQSGLDALGTVRLTQPVLPVIIITGFDSIDVRTRAADLDVAHVIPKGESLDRLCEAIATYTGTADGSRASVLAPRLRLSTRKITTLELIARGLTTAEIGTELGVGTRTAEEAIAWLQQRLGARNRPSLVMEAVRHGFLTPPPLS